MVFLVLSWQKALHKLLVGLITLSFANHIMDQNYKFYCGIDYITLVSTRRNIIDEPYLRFVKNNFPKERRQKLSHCNIKSEEKEQKWLGGLKETRDFEKGKF